MPELLASIESSHLNGLVNFCFGDTTMKLLLPFLAVCCFAVAGVGCKSSCSSCSHDHEAKCCGKCDGANKCCGKCGKDKADAAEEAAE